MGPPYGRVLVQRYLNILFFFVFVFVFAFVFLILNIIVVGLEVFTKTKKSFIQKPEDELTNTSIDIPIESMQLCGR